MKSSYKLFGTFWDKLKTSTTVSYLNDSAFINSINEDYNLFDLNGIRKVDITDILEIKNEVELEILLDKMKNYNSLLININYLPTNKNRITDNFYSKRINQIYVYFKEKLENQKVYLSSNYKEYLDKIKKWFNLNHFIIYMGRRKRIELLHTGATNQRVNHFTNGAIYWLLYFIIFFVFLQGLMYNLVDEKYG